MLSCQVIQYPPFTDIEQRIGCPRGWSVEASLFDQQFSFQPRGSVSTQRQPLAELDNNYSPAAITFSQILLKDMQPERGQNHVQSPDDSQGHRRSYGHIRDTGLGISAHDMYNQSYSSVSSITSPSLYSINEQLNFGGMMNQQSLNSPFDENVSNMWAGSQRNSSISTTMSPVYGRTSEQIYMQPQHGYISTEQAMSPAHMSQYQSNTNYLPENAFRRPAIRQNSTTSIMPQRAYHNSTPTSEFSDPQHSSQFMTSQWQDQGHHGQDSLQVPDAMLDCSSCENSPNYEDYNNVSTLDRSTSTAASRRKPHLRPSFSESCVPRMSSPARMRAASMGHYLQMPAYGQYMPQQPVPQLPLPPVPPTSLISTPSLPTPSKVLPATQGPIQHHRTGSNTARRKRPTSPPPSDFNSQNMPYLAPIKQDPAFPGDVYTPRYKRRTPNGRWEGWCGYCSPGRWLDLKNSRFWEDKLRNHGICAKTKMRFEEPIQIRWVSADGTVVPEEALAEGSDPFVDQRKREGLCGECHSWIGMDGLRTKARDRAVGWWMHAYKCHDHEKTSQQVQTG